MKVNFMLVVPEVLMFRPEKEYVQENTPSGVVAYKYSVKE